MERLSYLLTVLFTILLLLLFNSISQAQTSFNVSNKTTGDTLFTIDEAGDVGIGTTSPNFRLDVNSIDPNISASIGLSNQDISHYLRFYSGRLDSPYPTIFWNETDALRFGNSLNGFTEYMRLSSNGNVGIGTTSPTEMLEVADTIYSSIGGFKFPDGTVQESAASAASINNLTDGKTGGNSVFLGEGAGLNDDGSNNYNSALGVNALFSTTSGENNTVIGFNALYSNTSGSRNISIGDQSNYFNQLGNYNTMIGYQAGRGTALHNKSGNVFLGYQAGYNETGSNKLYIENSNISNPLIWGDFGTDSVRIHGDLHVTGNIHTDGSEGINSINGLSDGKAGGGSVFLGSGAGEADNGAYNYNTALGTNAYYSGTSGINNTAIGSYALYENTTGQYNIGIGESANYNNQEGSRNTIIGFEAGRGGGGVHNKSGNVFIGFSAGFYETGDNKLYINNSGSTSPLIWGDFSTDSLRVNGNIHVTGNFYCDEGLLSTGSFGSSGIPIEGAGTRMMWYSGKGAFRVGRVYDTGSAYWDDDNIGDYSFAAGYNTRAADYSFAMGNNTTAGGINSLAFGNSSTANSSYSMAIGYGAWAYGFSSTAIGYGAIAYSYNSFALGRFNNDTGDPNSWRATDIILSIGDGTSDGARSNLLEIYKNGNMWIQGTLTQNSDRNLKTNIQPLTKTLKNIQKINGVSYQWKNKEEMGNQTEIGVVAQDVEKVYPELVGENEGYKTTNYIGLIPVLVEAIKEQQKIIERQNTNLEELQNRIEKLENKN